MPLVFTAAAEKFRDTPLRYGTLVVTNYSWGMEVSTNLVEWFPFPMVVVSTNAIATNIGPMRFFRMVGQP